MSPREGIATIFTYLKAAVFPLFCVLCDTEGQALCPTCQQRILLRPQYFCPVCHHQNEGGEVCAPCRPLSALDRHLALFPFCETDPIAKLLHQYKYNFVEELSAFFAHSIRTFFVRHQSWSPQAIDAVVAVPLHRRRLAERGFNQADTLARMVGRHLQVPVLPVLRRIRYTKQQARLNKTDRLVNVRDAFAAAKTFDLHNYKHVLLVDDVFTTGSTMQAAAAALQRSDPRVQITGFTLARG